MAQEENDSGWSAALAQSIAGEVRRHRQRQGLSAQQLADRCAAIGMPIQRSVLANLESGRRTTVTVAELLVLARALNVPPGALVYPVGYAVQTEVLPYSYLEPLSALDWLSGRVSIDSGTDVDYQESPIALIRAHQRSANDLRRSIQERDAARRESLKAAERAQEMEAREVSIVSRQAELNGRVLRAAANGENVVREDVARIEELRDELAAQRPHSAEVRIHSEQVQRRVAALEGRTESIERELRAIRAHVQQKGLVAPLLPRILSYVDPEGPAYEDVPDILRDPQAAHDLLGITYRTVDAMPVGLDESAQAPPSSIGNVGDAEPNGGLIEEIIGRLQPLIESAVTAGVEQALSERDKRDGQ